MFLGVHIGIKHQCDKCKYIAPTKHALNKHKKRKHYTTTSEISLETKNQQSQTEKKLKETKSVPEMRNILRKEKNSTKKMKSVTKNDPKGYPCAECNKSFANVKYLRRHVGTVHAVNILACEHCAYTTNRMDSLKKHQECKTI